MAIGGKELVSSFPMDLEARKREKKCKIRKRKVKFGQVKGCRVGRIGSKSYIMPVLRALSSAIRSGYTWRLGEK